MFTQEQFEDVKYQEVPYDEWNSILLDIEQHCDIFYELWSRGRPRLTKEVPTAAIVFSEEGNVLEFLFNPTFWKTLTHYDRLFVISHEMMHIMLEHGERGKHIPKDMRDVGNIAMDVSINHMLCDTFGFDRNQISIQKDLCWLDTVKWNQRHILRGQNFEYYYNNVYKPDASSLYGKLKLDSHGGLPSSSDMEGLADILDEIEQATGKTIDGNGRPVESEKGKSEKKAEGDNPHARAGTSRGSTIARANYVSITRMNYANIIKNIATKSMKKAGFIEPEQWARINRRFILMDQNVFLPQEHFDEDVAREKIRVWFFQDYSGSCVHLKDKFFTFSQMIPKKFFDIKFFVFDTDVSEVDPNDRRLRGGGGTSFSCINSYIERRIKEKAKERYPDAVFVCTDGEGNRVSPKKPERWHWFLAGRGYCRADVYVPKESYVYDINRYVGR